MKKNHVAVVLGLVMSASLLSGCGSTSSSSSSTQTDTGTIYGEVSEVSDDGITIEVGTMKENAQGQPGDQSSDDKSASDSSGNSKNDSTSGTESTDNKSADNESSDSTADSKSTDSESSDSTADSKSTNSKSTDSSSDSKTADSSSDSKPGDGEAPSMLDKTGEEKEITVSSDTEITKENPGGPGQGGPGQDGEAPSGGAPSGQAPSGDNNNSSNEQPPEKPSDDNNSKSDNSSSDSNSSTDSNSSSDSGSSDSNKSTNGQPPEKPADDNNGSSDNSKSDDSSKSSDNSKSDDKTDSSSEDISLSDISEGDIVSVTYDDDGNVDKITVLMSANGGMGSGGQQSQAPDSYEAVKEYTKDTTKSDKTVTSEGTDENAIHAYDGAEVSLNGYNITRKSSDSQGGDNSSFYGVGAAVLESDGTLYLKDSTIETDSKGAAGIFAYNDGTVYTADTKITTTQDTSGGIHVAGGGKLYAWDMDIETSGESSAAIRSDRGGGEMVVNGGSYTSNGTGSPAIYSTADIAVNKADLTANGSEAVCIEGLNSVHLFNSNLTGNMSDNEQNDCTWNVILYQSMSGDSEVGNSTFEMDGGTLTAKNGGMFYTTNTESTITLSDVDITYADDNDFFLKCTGNSNQRGWGTSGDNGADCLFTAVKQDMEGDIVWDSISQLDFYMTDGSTLKGAVTDDESNAGDGGDGYCNMYIEKGSTWTVTGDSTLTSLQNAGTIVDESGKTVTIKGTDGTVYVEGDSEYTVTVGSYKNSADVSGASKTSSWSDYKVTRPSSLKN